MSRSVGRDTCNCSGAELTHRNTTTTAKCQTQIELDMQHLQECTMMTQESGEESNNDQSAFNEHRLWSARISKQHLHNNDSGVQRRIK